MSAKECGCGLQLGFQGDQTRNLYRQIVESLPCFACFENLSRIIRNAQNESRTCGQGEQAGVPCSGRGGRSALKLRGEAIPEPNRGSFQQVVKQDGRERSRGDEDGPLHPVCLRRQFLKGQPDTNPVRKVDSVRVACDLMANFPRERPAHLLELRHTNSKKQAGNRRAKDRRVRKIEDSDESEADRPKKGG